jgi:DTW domain-containing protein YfiP
MLTALCLCAEIPRFELATRVVVVMHRKEASRTSNTGRLACLALANSEIRMRGGSEILAVDDLLSDTRYSPALLYPTEEAEVLNANAIAKFKRPLLLFVPDGNWRQASKVSIREKSLREIPRYKLPQGLPSRYRLRRSPHPHHLSTIEAIARALGCCEGPEVQRALEELLEKHVERTFQSRGRSK